MTPDWTKAPKSAKGKWMPDYSTQADSIENQAIPQNISKSSTGRYHPRPTRLPCRPDDTTMDAYSTKLTVIAALLLTLLYLFYDLMLHPLPR